MAYIKKAIPSPPWQGLPFPSGFSPSWNQLKDSLKSYISGVALILEPVKGSRMLPDALYLTYKSISTAAFSAIVNRPSVVDAWSRLIEAEVSTFGKLNKLDVVYLDVNPPPVFWDYKCLKCRWWGPKVGLVDQTCKVVEGIISPNGWCAIWLPPDDYKALTWPKELLEGGW